MENRHKDVLEYATKIFTTSNEEKAKKTWSHTWWVTKKTIELAKDENINIEILKTAAILHDIALIDSEHQGHEEKSAKRAEEILTQFGYSKEEIYQITHCIIATDNITEPITREAQLLLKADNMFYKKGNKN